MAHRRPFEPGAPGTNGRGPMRELGRFYEELLGILKGKGMLRRDTLVPMVTRQRRGLRDTTFQCVMDWGLGFIPHPPPAKGEFVPYGFGPYASASAFGHGGAQCTSAFADPEHELVVAWGCNGMPGEPAHQKRASAIHRAIYEDLRLA